MTAIDPKLFRNALGSFTTGVTVVTTVGTKGEDIGMTANSFNSVSLEPPMVLWSLAKSSLSLDAFKAADHFAVHILAAEQEELSSRFAKRGVDKFADLDLERGADNVPLLTECAARFMCKTAYQYEGGDHIIFVGEVLDFEHWERSPLLFHAGQYGLLADNKNQDKNADRELNHEFLGELLRQAYGGVYGSVRDEYASRDISIAQYYLISRIAQQGHPKLDATLQHLRDISRCPSDEEVLNLKQRNIIAVENEEVKLTSDGSQLNMELASVVKSAESDALGDLDYELRQTLVMALEQLINTINKS